jgi:hypothetical protein
MSVVNFLEQERDNTYFTIPVIPSVIQHVIQEDDPVLRITQADTDAVQLTGDMPLFEMVEGRTYVVELEFYIACIPSDPGDVNKTFQFEIGWKESVDDADPFIYQRPDSVNSGSSAGGALWTKVSKKLMVTSNGAGTFRFALRPSFNGFQGGVVGNLEIVIPGKNPYGAMNLQFSPFTMTLWT